MKNKFLRTAFQKMLFFFVFTMVCQLLIHASVLPNGFSETKIAGNLDPTDMVIAPDGRIFITEKNGKILVVKNNQLLATPFVDISANVDNFNERGLGHLVLDPGFSTNGFIYVYYTVKGQSRNRVSRFKASGDVATGGEVIVMDISPVPNTTIHNGGAMNFGLDGKLYVAVGDGAIPSFAQDMNTQLGKVLRINSDGTIPTDNPFYNSATGNNRAIYALGLRNPFSGDIQPGTGKFFVNDVGQSNWEEINEIQAGRNYGWGIIDGPLNGQTPPTNYKDPTFYYPHNNGYCSIIGATFYNPTQNQFPAQYQGRYFFGDYCAGTIRMLDPVTNTLTGVFATNIARPLAIRVAVDGTMYYLERGNAGTGSTGDNTSANTGNLWKITYTGSGVPTIAQQPASITVGVGTTATFTTSASGNAPLTYQWQKNNTNIAGATSPVYVISNVQLADNGARFKCIVTNSLGLVTSNEALLTVNTNKAPTAIIDLPLTSTTFKFGDVITFSGSGADPEEGAVPASRMTWWVDFHHDTHTHPGLPTTSGINSGTFTCNLDETSDNIWVRIYLKVTDSQGASNTIYHEIFPQKVKITLNTIPSGIPFNLDGGTVNTNYTFNSVKKVVRNLVAPPSFSTGGNTYLFKGWSNGLLTPSLALTTPENDLTLTATYELTASNANGLTARFYHNTTSFTTPEILKRTDNTINFDWKYDSPAVGTVNTDNFCVRWTGQLQAQFNEAYTFYTSTDDGIRLWIDDKLVIDKWIYQPTTEWNGKITLNAGQRYDIKIEYFDGGGEAVCKLFWSSPSTPKQLVPSFVLFPESGSVTTTCAIPVNLTSADIHRTSATLAWNSVAEAESYKVQYKLVNASDFTTVSVNTNSLLLQTLTCGSSYVFKVQAVCNGASAGIFSAEQAFNTTACEVNTCGLLPSGWNNQDVGETGIKGSSCFANGKFTLQASGRDIWDNADGFQLAYQSFVGDGELTVRVDSLTAANPWAKAGIMFRESLDATARHAMMVLTPTPTYGAAFQYRTVTGGTSSNVNAVGIQAPYFVKLVKAGSMYSGYVSVDKLLWEQIGTAVDVGFGGGTVYAGLVLSSHDNNTLARTVFSQVSNSSYSDTTASASIWEAEEATLSGVKVSNLWTGYTGTGFADYINPNADFIQWNVQVGAAGIYQLGFRYAQGSNANRPLALKVNEVVVQPALAFAPTTAWTDWQWVRINTSLVAGNNTIRLTATGLSGANMDRLEVNYVRNSNLRETEVSSKKITNQEPSAEILIFPNPVTESKLTINKPKNASIEIRDLQGKKMEFNYITQDENQSVLEISTLKNGMYILQCLVGGTWQMHKFIVLR
ncbi:MAG: PQQ-dependent sugar dehydrogenase [Verrucomicrobia bacterium]|nr:PQQ-dependent sugar dehydrogenase [Cytophagales bacterium]